MPQRRTPTPARKEDLLRLSCVGQGGSPARRLRQDWRQLLACVQDDLGQIRTAAGANLPQETRKGLRLWGLRARRDLERAEVVMAVALELLGGVETCLRCAQGECRQLEPRAKASGDQRVSS